MRASSLCDTRRFIRQFEDVLAGLADRRKWAWPASFRCAFAAV